MKKDAYPVLISFGVILCVMWLCTAGLACLSPKIYLGAGAASTIVFTVVFTCLFERIKGTYSDPTPQPCNIYATITGKDAWSDYNCKTTDNWQEKHMFDSYDFFWVSSMICFLLTTYQLACAAALVYEEPAEVCKAEEEKVEKPKEEKKEEKKEIKKEGPPTTTVMPPTEKKEESKKEVVTQLPVNPPPTSIVVGVESADKPKPAPIAPVVETKPLEEKPVLVIKEEPKPQEEKKEEKPAEVVLNIEKKVEAPAPAPAPVTVVMPHSEEVKPAEAEAVVEHAAKKPDAAPALEEDDDMDFLLMNPPPADSPIPVMAPRSMGFSAPPIV